MYEDLKNVVLMFSSILLLLYSYETLNKKDINIFKYCIYTFLILYFLFVIIINGTIPKVSLNGDKDLTLTLNEEYKEEGYNIYIHNKKIYPVVTIKENVNTSKTGNYKVTYILNYFGEKIVKERNIKVIDNIVPKIYLKGDSTINTFLNQEYKEEGYTALDNVDGDITSFVKISGNLKNEVGTYNIKYEVKDFSGNSTHVNRTINVLKNNNGIIYLTFDDGPSSITEKVLDILKEEKVKATFFVVGFDKSDEHIIKRIVEEGHTLAIHSYTHVFRQIYASEKAYFDDLNRIKNRIKGVTGIDSNIIRFPGGSSNTASGFNKGIMKRLTKSVLERGYHYFDWNVSSKDAEGAKSSIEIYNNVISTLSKKRSNIVIMHDHQHSNRTLGALRDIIIKAKAKGYSFDKITEYTPMVRHRTFN